MVNTLSSHEFIQDTGITDHGEPAHVLMNFKNYERLTGKSKNILDLVGMKDARQIDFQSEKISRLTKIPKDFFNAAKVDIF
jgi:hypothetical protein